MPDLPRLMLVTDRHVTRGRDLVSVVGQAVAGGVGIVQVREKDLPEDDLRALVRRVGEAVPDGTRLQVNGRAAVARSEGAGLHLPAASALPWKSGERPPEMLLGRSAHDLDEARSARDDGADYVILGPAFPTPSKPGHAGHGARLVRTISRAIAPLPVYVIGGVTLPRIPELLHAGAHGVAVCRAILSANDPGRQAQAMRLALHVGAGS